VLVTKSRWPSPFRDGSWAYFGASCVVLRWVRFGIVRERNPPPAFHHHAWRTPRFQGLFPWLVIHNHTQPCPSPSSARRTCIRCSPRLHPAGRLACAGNAGLRGLLLFRPTSDRGGSGGSTGSSGGVKTRDRTFLSQFFLAAQLNLSRRHPY